MGQAANRSRENRTITVDFQNEATYLQLLGDGKAFVEFVFAFILSLGFQLAHKASCRGGGCLTRHSHYVRLRVRGLTIWRIQCMTCRAVFTVLPHFVLRYRSMPQGVELRAPRLAHRRCDGHQFLRELEERVAQAGAHAYAREQRPQTLGCAVEAIGEGPFDPV